MARTAAPRALFYSHDSFGLGHLRRTVSLAEALLERNHNASVLIASGSPVPDLFPLPPRCDVIKLPCVGKDDSGGYAPRRLPQSLAEVVELRSTLLTAAARAFRPHLLLVDHTPTGPHGELLPTLRRLRHEQLRTHVVLGLRDVLDAPHRVRAELVRHGAHAVMRELFDDILVYGDRQLLDVADSYALGGDLADRLRYVGAVCPRGALPPIDARADGHQGLRVLACAGGGEDGYDLLRRVIAAARGPLRDTALALTVVAGPLLPEAQRQALRAACQADPRIELLDSAPSLAPWIATADVVVGMAGYNTVYEVLRAGRPLLVQPRTQPRQEQLERARRLEAMGLLRTVSDAATVDLSVFAGELLAAAAATPPAAHRCPVPLDGAERAAEYLLQRVSGEVPSAARCAGS